MPSIPENRINTRPIGKWHAYRKSTTLDTKVILLTTLRQRSVHWMTTPHQEVTEAYSMTNWQRKHTSSHIDIRENTAESAENAEKKKHLADAAVHLFMASSNLPWFHFLIQANLWIADDLVKCNNSTKTKLPSKNSTKYKLQLPSKWKLLNSETVRLFFTMSYAVKVIN